jgi:hypothetical protein
MCTWNYPSITVSLLFFSRSRIRIVSPAICPPGHNNNDARGRAIYVEAVADSGGDITHACSSLSSKLMVWVIAIRHDLQDTVPPHILQSSWCRSYSLPSVYRPCHRVLLGQSSFRSFFFFFFRWDTTALCIYLLIKMMSEQHISLWLRPRPPWPRLRWH